MSLSSIPTVKGKPFHSNTLKGRPVRGSEYYAQHLLHPLKSLGRLVTDTQAVMPFNFTAGTPSFFGHGGHQTTAVNVLHEQIFNVSNIPYFNRMMPGVGHTIYSKYEELAAVVTEHATGPLSVGLSDFSSPASSERSSAPSLSPSKESLFHLRGTELSPKKTRTYSFSEDDLFMVLYGYSRSQEQNAVCNSERLTLETEALGLPKGLSIHQTSYGSLSHYGVFAEKSAITKGTRFGPFQGKLVNTSEIKTYDDNTLMWECARFPEEQNLIAVQSKAQIFYEACKAIQTGQELLVWYGDCYVQFLGIPLTLKDSLEEGNAMLPHEDAGEGFKCDRCGKVFAYQYYRDKHLKYTRCVDQGDRKFPCHLCNRSFEKRDRLRIHVLHAFTASSILRTHIRQHSGERPFKCKHCGKAFASHAAHDSHVRRTHAKDKPYPCDVCGSTFQEATELNNHTKSHTERPLSDNAVPPTISLNGSLEDTTTMQKFSYTGLTVLNPEYRPWN
ncbi:unnamed protein product [Coregonus sp. 'balchen']|nr:unnamed protein product [Coregonus sp. 'balchen']